MFRSLFLSIRHNSGSNVAPRVKSPSSVCSCIFAVSAFMMLVPFAQADIIGPYSADESTLHLWHMNEAHPGPALPDGGVSGSFNLNLTGGTLGNSSYAGFDTAGRSHTGRIGNPSFISTGSMVGAGGAFTMEAIINTTALTTGFAGNTQQIMSMDVAAGRSFQFRIQNSNDGLNPSLSFVTISPGIQSMSAALPTTGADAFVVNDWYHAAVTYNGLGGIADNMKFTGQKWTTHAPKPV